MIGLYGAGISQSVGLPGWSDLLNDLIELAKGKLKPMKIY
jgi:hypothetical protein